MMDIITIKDMALSLLGSVYSNLFIFMIVLVFILILFWIIIANVQSVDDIVWNFLTFCLMVFLMFSFLVLVDNGTIHPGFFETIGQKISEIF